MDVGSRDERRLMRQRGAGTRNINNNIDFGLSFPTPTNARPSKTPSTNRRVSKRMTKTPARRSVSQEPTATAAPLPEASTVPRVNKRKSSFLDAVTVGPEPATGKKRRLNNATPEPSRERDQAGNSLINGSGRSIPRRRVSRKSDYIAIAEEASDEEEPAPVDEIGVEIVQDTAEPSIDPQEDKENDEPVAGAAQGKRRKKKSMKFTRPKKRSSTGSLQEEQAGRLHRVLSQEPTTGNEVLRSSADRPEASGTFIAEARTLRSSVRYQNGVAIPTKTPRAKLQQQEDIATIDKAEVINPTGKVARKDPTPAEDEEPEAEDSVLSLQDNGPLKKRRKRKSIVVKKRGGRRVSAQLTTSASPILRPRRAPARTASPTATPYQGGDENEDETYIPEEVSPERPTPAITKKTRKNAKLVRSIESDNPAPEPRRQRSTPSELRQSGFPITTHRLINTSTLPTITEENGPSSDDELNELSNFGNRTAPNAVDVLSQICRETVASALANIGITTAGSDLKRKSEALMSFGREMDSRLFDMSAAVENRLTLEGRVRASKREKGEMQARWMEVRRKREEVALSMDRVRREHWESEEVGKRSWKLSEAAFGVGVLKEREKGTETESLEYLLQTLGRGVSGTEGGGVLQMVKDFNARMERMVDVLETGEEGA